MSRTHIWWIRRDIRLSDNQALQAACQGADQLIPLFIIEPELMDRAGPRRRAFLLNALADLDQQLRKLGSRLIIRQGPAGSALQSLVDELGGAHIYAHEDFSPFARQRDQAVAELMTAQPSPASSTSIPQPSSRTMAILTWFIHPSNKNGT
jgi:deoxyribodipyrimidine photo-lyase